MHIHFKQKMCIILIVLNFHLNYVNSMPYIIKGIIINHDNSQNNFNVGISI